MRTSSLLSVPGHRPHDLLWLDEASAVVPLDAVPAWATAAWLSVAPVVVRRAPPLPGHVPIGLRGVARNERCAAHVADDRIIRKVSPRDIACHVSRYPLVRESKLPCLRTLARLALAL